MADRNLDIALRIKADMGAARQQIDAINQAVTNTGKAADSSNAALGRASQRMEALVDATQQAVQVLQSMDARLAALAQGSVQIAQATAQVEAGTAAAVTGLRDLAETEDQAAARIRAVIAASREQMAAEQAAAAAAAEVTAGAQQRSQATEDLAQSIQRQNAQMRQSSDAAAAAAAAERQAGAAAQDHAAELARLLGQIDPTIAALERLDQQEQELQRFRDLGVLDAEGYAQFRAQIDQSRAALGRMGTSAGQTAQAMRMLPAQITDVTVSLAAGMPVWMVFLQQGSQIKDSFGGLRPTLQALGEALTPLRVAIGGSVAVLGLLAIGLTKGYLEAQRLGTALIATGNYAGTTATQLQALASTVGASSHSYGDASQAVLLLAQSGKITRDAMNDATRGAVAFAQVTGSSIAQAVEAVISMGDRPVDAVRKLDEQYHFLETSVYEQIRALQEQGRETEAAALAQRSFADAMEERRNRDVQNLGAIQRAWADLNDQLERGWNLIKNFGSHNLQQQLDLLYYARGAAESLRLVPLVGDSLADRRIADIDKQIEVLKQQADQEQATAEAESKHRQEQEHGNAALDRIAATTKKYATAAERYQQELDEINANFDAAIKAMPAKAGELNAQRSELLRRAVTAYAESLTAASPKARDTTSALSSAMKSLQDQILSLGQNALGPVSGIWDQYTKAMLAAADAGGKAIKAGGDVATVQGLVSQVQDLAAQARDRALADQQRNLQIAYAQATGDQAAAAKLQIEAQYGDLLQDLQRRGDQAGVRLVQSLINVGEARAQLQQLQQQVNTVLSDESRQEQAIQAEQQAGLISEYSARKQILDLHQQTGEQLDQLLPKYRALAQTIGDPTVTDQLKNTEAEVQRLKLATNDFKTAFESGFEGGLEQALEGLATRTMSVRDAFRALADSVLQSLAQIAARALADKAISAIGSLFGGGGNANVGQDATKLAAAGGVVTGAAVMLGTSADKLQAAAGTLLVANSLSSFGGGYASGGYTGPGGVYDVAGVVHAGEYVQPAYRMGEPGALAFMRDFHQQGMAAIDAWALRGYAEGGYVAPLTDAPRLSAPRTPAPRLPDMAANDARGPTVGVRVINVTDPSQVGDYLDSSDGEAKILNIISRNESRVRQMVR